MGGLEIRAGSLAPFGRGIAFGAILLLGVPLGLWMSTPEPASHISSAPREFRLLDYNVHSAVNDGQVDLEALATTIESRDPSIVVLQEASRGWPVTGMTDVVEWLSWRLRMPYLYGPAGDGPYGTRSCTSRRSGSSGRSKGRSHRVGACTRGATSP